MQNVEKLKAQLPELPWEKAKRYQDELGIKKIDAGIISEDKKNAQLFEEVLKQAQKEGINPQDLANHIINKRPNVDQTSTSQIIENIKNKTIGVIGGDSELEELAKQAMEQDPKAVEDFRGGKENSIQVLIGAVMRLSSGKANVAKLKPLLTKLLLENKN